ncbi:MAG TPA: TetR/AcrR family transcriptional regulator [Saprospiraceae bacterium]|nr:TetR/AcrR family transcriptional regulator [Saprospiraceae bacterium]
MVEKETDRSQIKLEQILTAAQKRFGHYGLSKTAMNDIANDIGMSKASLYYYFKDKESIFIAVLEKEHIHFIEAMHKMIKTSVKAETMLIEYVSMRTAVLEKMMALGKFSYDGLLAFKPQISSLLQQFKKEETSLIYNILEFGVRNKEFSMDSIQEHATFFIDTLLSIRKAVIAEHAEGDTIEFSPRKYQKLKDQSNMFASIFIKGISA